MSSGRLPVAKYVESESTRLIETVCSMCGKHYIYLDRNKEFTKCPACGYSHNKTTSPRGKTAPAHTYVPDKARPSTHNQIRLYCSECEHLAIVWVPKKNRKPGKCPKCGAKGSKIRVTKIRPEGDCRTEAIWECPNLASHVTNVKLLKKQYACPECGYLHYFLVKPPPTCFACNKSLKDYDKNSINMSPR